MSGLPWIGAFSARRSLGLPLPAEDPLLRLEEEGPPGVLSTGVKRPEHRPTLEPPHISSSLQGLLGPGLPWFYCQDPPRLNLPSKLGDRYSVDQVVRAGPAPEEAAGGDRSEAGGEGAIRSSSGIDPTAAGPNNQGSCSSWEGLGAPAPPAGPISQCEGDSLSPDPGARACLGHVQRPGAGAGHLERDP